MMYSVKVTGLDEFLVAMTPEQMKMPLTDFFESAAITVENYAREGAPKDTGRLAGSINHRVDPKPVPLWAKVGTNLFYAPYMEFGTGTLADGDDASASGRRHFPPPQALERWARRHGFGPGGGYIVARSIWRKGGLRPRKFLRNALVDAIDDIRDLVWTLGEELALVLGGGK